MSVVPVDSRPCLRTRENNTGRKVYRADSVARCYATTCTAVLVVFRSVKGRGGSYFSGRTDSSNLSLINLKCDDILSLIRLLSMVVIIQQASLSRRLRSLHGAQKVRSSHFYLNFKN